MPFSVNESGLPKPALFLKADSTVRSQGPFVAGEYIEVDAMKVEVAPSEVQSQRQSHCPDALSLALPITNPDDKLSIAMDGMDMSELNSSDQSPVAADAKVDIAFI